jgi:hypothetical protein
MNINLPFPLPGNRTESAARRCGKPPTDRPPLALEALEELTVPSAMLGALRAGSALVPSRPAITAPLTLAVSLAATATHAPGGIPAELSSSQSSQASLHGASKVLSTVASDLRQRAGPLSGIAGSVLHRTAPQLTSAIAAASGQRASPTGSGAAQQIEILLGSLASNPGAIPSNRSSPAGSGTANPVQGVNTVVTGVTGNLNNAAANLQALSDRIQSGTAATPTGEATPLLDRVMTDLAGSVRTVLANLKRLVGVLPDLMSIALGQAKQFVQSALRDVTDSLGVISESLDTIAVQLPGLRGNWPSDGPIAAAPADQSGSPPSSLGSLLGGLLTEVSTMLSTISDFLRMLAGSLSSVLAGATGAAAGPSSAAVGARHLVDTIFGGVA